MVRDRAKRQSLATLTHSPGPPPSQVSAFTFSNLLGLGSLSVSEIRWHAAAGAEDVVDQAVQPVRRTVSMMVSIAERCALAPCTLAAAMQLMSPLQHTAAGPLIM
jgi:hypothetical protein